MSRHSIIANMFKWKVVFICMQKSNLKSSKLLHVAKRLFIIISCGKICWPMNTWYGFTCGVHYLYSTNEVTEEVNKSVSRAFSSLGINYYSGHTRSNFLIHFHPLGSKHLSLYISYILLHFGGFLRRHSWLIVYSMLPVNHIYRHPYQYRLDETVYIQNIISRHFKNAVSRQVVKI